MNFIIMVFLACHGGKRNGPPYPLGASDHSASEKKAGWRKSLNKSSSDYANERDEVKGLKKRLNRNEDTYRKSTNEFTKQGARGMRALSKGDAETLQDVANKQFLANANIKKAEQDTWKTIAKLVDKGYDVSMEPYLEYANKGQKIASRLLTVGGLATVGVGVGTLNPALGAAGMTALGIGSGLTNAEKIQLNRYRVEKNPNGGKGRLYMQNRVGEREEKTFEKYDLKDKSTSNNSSSSNNSSTNKRSDTDSSNKTKTSNNVTSKNNDSGFVYTQKEMQEKITTARNKDQWDLEFLERYDPEDYYQEWNQADAIKEYKKYLKDPYKYHYEPPTATNKF